MKRTSINTLLAVITRLRGPHGCPWDRKQDHRSLRYHSVEEVYELIDAIEAGNDDAIEEELGDLLLHVLLHCQMASERNAFDFDRVARRLAQKLIRRHPHVFGTAKVQSASAVLAQWDRIKAAENKGGRAARRSALDGIPRHFPAVLRAQKLWKKATNSGLARPKAVSDRLIGGRGAPKLSSITRRAIGSLLFELVGLCHAHDWLAEELLLAETKRRERTWRQFERRNRSGRAKPRSLTL